MEHTDSYPHNCPGCIYSHKPAGDALLDEHATAVLKLRQEATRGANSLEMDLSALKA